MQYEVSSGAVVFIRKDNDIYFVIVKSLEEFYVFPKGHIEENETEEEVALRKIYEGVGIKTQILPEFMITNKYVIKRRNWKVLINDILVRN